jgi:FeS assembly protein IscX
MDDANSVVLDWESSFEIALALMAVYPDVQLEDVSLNQLKTWIVALPNFVDDPDLGTDTILMDVFREWYEEANA